MVADSKAYAAHNGGSRPTWPFLISLTGHLLLFGLILLNPQWSSRSDTFMPSVIDVQMIDLTDAGKASSEKMTSTEKAPVKESRPESKPEPREEASVATPPPSPVKPEVSVAEAKPSPKKKVALKYQTFKSKTVIKNALENLENRVEKEPPRALEDTIKRLKEEVAEKEKTHSTSSVSEVDANAPSKSGAFARGSKQEIELIDIYQAEIAMQIQKNWAFSEGLADRSKNLVASLIFQILPDGRITDIFFVDRSGNQYLDDSAMKAIMKSSPVKPFPKKLDRTSVEMGLRFTPEGVN